MHLLMTTYRQDITCVIHGRSFPKYTQVYLSTEEQFHYIIVQKYSQLPLRRTALGPAVGVRLREMSVL